MSTYDVFISYNSLDHDAVLKVAEALRSRGLVPFLDRWYLVPGTNWIDALEKPLASCRSVAIFLGLHGLGRWQQRERDLALDRQAKDQSFPVIPVLLPGADPPLGFLSQNTWVDLQKDIAVEALALAIEGKPPGADLADRIAATRAAICPYRGLRPFREEDEAFFCGREAFTSKLVDVVNRRNLIALVGASGSGKSSVVRAGLVPNLRRRRDFVWEFITIRPQDRPLYNLAAGLIPLLDPQLSEIDQLQETAKLASSLTDGPLELRDVVEKILAKQPGTDRLLLVVDQWEELYTLCKDEAAQQRFIAQLVAAAASGNCFVILTLRADFYSRVVDNRALSDPLGDGVVNIGPMKREELERSITEPARKNSLRFEDGLVKRILDDVGQEPGNLPLLEFLLTELWEKRHGPELELTAYEAIGGVRRAIAEQAEKTFQRLNSAEQEAAQSALLALVVPGEGTEDTRRRAALGDLNSEERAVIAKFTADRLLVTTRDPSGRDVVEVGHEALIREWDRLRLWVNEDRQFLRTLRRVEQDEASWQAAGEDPSLLLPTGLRLVEAKELLSSQPKHIAARVQSYIDASVTADRKRQEEREREEKEKQEAIRRAERKTLVRTQVAAVAVLVLSIGIGVSAWLAQRARYVAEQQAGITIEFSKGVLVKAGEYLNSGAVLTSAVKGLLEIAETALDKLQKMESSQDLKDQQISFLLTVSDAYVELGNNKTALEKALLADQLLANASRDRDESQRLLWASNFRIGDALIEKGDKTAALPQYLQALSIAERFAARKPDDPDWQDRLLFLHDKVGETLRMDGHSREALEHYDKSLAIEQQLIAKYPDKVFYKHRMSATRNRMGDAIGDQGDLSKALDQYKIALDLSNQVAEREQDDQGHRLTLAVRHSRIGSTLAKLGDRAGALDELNKSKDIRKQLADRDPNNASYQNYLASSFTALGNFFRSEDKFDEAVKNFQDGVKIRQQLVEKDPDNRIWHDSLEEAQNNLKDALAKQKQQVPEDSAKPPLAADATPAKQ
jgi:tetratricopeptide (TPR) repeat protein